VVWWAAMQRNNQWQAGCFSNGEECPSSLHYVVAVHCTALIIMFSFGGSYVAQAGDRPRRHDVCRVLGQGISACRLLQERHVQ